MSYELKELTEFIKQFPPLDKLDPEAIRDFASGLELSYSRKGTELLSIGDENRTLYLLRSGAVALYDDNKNLVDKLAEGKFFGYLSVLANVPVRFSTVCIEDSLLIECPKEHFDAFRIREPVFDNYFTVAYGERIRKAVQNQAAKPLSTLGVDTLIKRSPVTVSLDTSIKQAAIKMADENVSALLIIDNHALCGIITDKDLRKRVVAAGIDASMPVSKIMTAAPLTLQKNTSVTMALLTMMQNNIHHLPVCSEHGLQGLITINDIVRAQADHPVFLVGDIAKQNTVEDLVLLSKRVPELFAHLVQMDAKASDVGRMMTAITDAFTQRLLEMAFDKYGNPSIDYAWLALGSQARKEQTAKTDQDNAFILENNASQQDKDFFLKIANFVNSGLDQCGYIYCPGEVMASNPKWCESLDTWKQYFRHWIEQPTPKALMHVNIFFDLRCIAGNAALVNELRHYVASRAQSQRIFHGLMYKNSLDFQPPIGFFRQFLLEKSGEHKNTFDVKHQGLVPIIDLARIYMLMSGKPEEHTMRRLHLASNEGVITEQTAESLLDAYEFISYLRIQHQGKQLAQGIKPDNHLSPKEFSPLVRDQLRSAFGVVSTAQKALAQQFPNY